MSVHSSDCSIEPLLSCVGTYAVFQRILRRNDEMYAVKSSFFDQMPDDGQMAYVQRIERTAVYCSLHNILRVTTLPGNLLLLALLLRVLSEGRH